MIERNRITGLVALLVAALIVVACGGVTPSTSTPETPVPIPKHEVYGFVPYWEMDGSIADHLAQTELTTLALFSVTNTRDGSLDTKQNGYKRITGDVGKRMIREAHDRGVRVELVFTSFGSARNERLFGPGAAAPKLQDATIDSLVTLVTDLGLDGVNVDVERLGGLENVPSYASFVQRLRTALREANPEAQVSVATTADRQGAAMAAASTAGETPGADRVFLMAYDYRVGRDAPGASAPMDRRDGSEQDLVWSLDLYEAVGVPVGRTLLGLPLYGLTWPVAGPSLGEVQTANGDIWVPADNRGTLASPTHPTGNRPGRDRRVLRDPAGGRRHTGSLRWRSCGRLERHLRRFAGDTHPQAGPRRRARVGRRRLLGDRLRARPARVHRPHRHVPRGRTGGTVAGPMSAPKSATSHRPVLTQAELGRATLARQALLEPASGDVVSAIERFGGLQAQEAASPFVALWARLDGFAAADLQAAFRERRVVKATMMRSTLHAVSAADYRALQPAVSPMLQPIRRQDRSRAPDPDHLDRLARIAAVHTAEPRTLGELRDHLASDDGATDLSPDEIVWWLRRHMTFIHAPDEAAPWSFGRRPRIVEAGSWLPGLAFEDQAAAGVHLVRRYLGAFGPATPADISAWSGVAVGRLRPSLAALDASGELWHACDERGRALRRPARGSPSAGRHPRTTAPAGDVGQRAARAPGSDADHQ